MEMNHHQVDFAFMLCGCGVASVTSVSFLLYQALESCFTFLGLKTSTEASSSGFLVSKSILRMTLSYQLGVAFNLPLHQADVTFDPALHQY